MKRIKIPFNKKTVSKLTLGIGWLFIIVYVGFRWGIANINWIVITLGLSIIMIIFWVSELVEKHDIVLVPKDVFEQKEIEEMNSKGFSFVREGELEKILWKQIVEVDILDNEQTHINPTRRSLKFKLEKNRTFLLEHDFTNWFQLIQLIPKYCKVSLSFKKYTEDLFSNLTTCEICGRIAVYNEECLSCGCGVYNSLVDKQFKNKTDYIRYHQIGLINSYEGEEFSFFVDNDNVFKMDLDWAPIVSIKNITGD